MESSSSLFSGRSLHQDLPPLILSQVPLADKCWFRTGGPAEWYSEPRNSYEFQAAVQWAVEQQQQITILGEGANVLISDRGIAGLTIRPALCALSHAIIDEQTAVVTAQAGAAFPALIHYCLSHNLLGLEEFSGIPGTVGGSVFINIHYFEWLLSDFLVSGTVLERATGVLSTVDHSWFQFSYNHSRLHEGSFFLVDATFRLRRGSPEDAAYARGRNAEIIRHRNQRYPRERTCGSFFRNFFEHEVTFMSNGKKMIYVAYYLDKVGVKGSLRIGGAQVSYQHANMIVTASSAKSADVLAVARRMQELVYIQWNVLAQPECRLMGFDDGALVFSR